MKRTFIAAALLVLMIGVFAACGGATPTPETITVIETVEKIVEKEGETVTVVETKEVVVTATPEPTASPYDENAPIEVWVDAVRMAAVDLWKEAHPDKAHLVNTTIGNRGTFHQQVLFFNNVGEGWPDAMFLAPRQTQHNADAAHDWPGDLLPWVPQEIIDNFAPGALEPCMLEGKLLCIRNDLAQSVLWYNVPHFENFGYEVPELWSDYMDIAYDVAENHPGYVVGFMSMIDNMYFWPSQCAFVEELDRGHVKIFDPEWEECVRAAEMTQELWDLGVMGVGYNDADMTQTANEDRIVMVIGPSWFGEHVFGGKENSMWYQTAEGQLGVALTPKWPDQDTHWSGAQGGGSWAMSRHTKNPKLASELLIWLTTDEGFQGENATTYPAYAPAAKVWGEKKVGINPMYAFDPMPILDEAAGYIWTTFTEKRFADTVRAQFAQWVLNPAVNGEQTVIEGLPKLREELINLAPTLGFAVIE
jgi:ABC-type glycerol-3-phosphate transport system substrate-binding protein